MAEELKDPQLIETYVRSYNEERQRLAATAIKTRRQLEEENATGLQTSASAP